MTALSNLITTDPHQFMRELVKKPQYLSREVAHELDELDPLAFAGHSLGPALKLLRTKILETLDLQASLHAGHFPNGHPDGKNRGDWFRCNLHAPSLEGAKQLLLFSDEREFLMTSNGLSDNLAMLVQQFYHPGAANWKAGNNKILMLKSEFFSDQAIVQSILAREIERAKSFDCFTEGNKPKPADLVILVEPDSNGLYTAESIRQKIQDNLPNIALVCLPDIVFNTGQRLKLADILNPFKKEFLARAIKVILDLAHTFGNRKLDIKSMPVTAAVTCGYKHASGPAGSGSGFYVSQDEIW